MSTARDELLCERSLEGDQDAWRELVERYARLVFSIPRRAGLDDATSEDVFQEVFATLWEKLPTIRNRRGLPKWLMTTAHRMTERHSRRRLPTSDVEPMPELAEEQMLTWERQHLLRRSLRELGGPCADLLTALYLGDNPGYDRIAETLGVPRGSIGPTRARCLEKLGRIFRRLEGFEADA
jgi:RNA polymerase sigma factor (sigma-70 family)